MVLHRNEVVKRKEVMAFVGGGSQRNQSLITRIRVKAIRRAPMNTNSHVINLTGSIGLDGCGLGISS